ncbi:hypothetical protein E1I69_20660 [Bacillus timonensis]|uniref:Uncharacterized protein n=1 Tax=Bacillus timonensis TaxID=1033734 RepID=A0A4S3PKJ7_9BACI|nr:hypothetical protein E1I69_20660 [Bacillus timonensis]
MFKTVHCPNCNIVYKKDDEVILDMYNTIHHQDCFHYDIPIKDRCSFGEICEKYDFFNELLPLN